MTFCDLQSHYCKPAKISTGIVHCMVPLQQLSFLFTYTANWLKFNKKIETKTGYWQLSLNKNYQFQKFIYKNELIIKILIITSPIATNTTYYRQHFIRKKLQNRFTGSKALALCHRSFTGFFLHSSKYYTIMQIFTKYLVSMAINKPTAIAINLLTDAHLHVNFK